jgi:hypothetical protein
LWSTILSLSLSDVILPRLAGEEKHTEEHIEKKTTDKLLAAFLTGRSPPRFFAMNFGNYEELPSAYNHVFN